jgi:hypothetical protein
MFWNAHVFLDADRVDDESSALPLADGVSEEPGSMSSMVFCGRSRRMRRTCVKASSMIVIWPRL